MFTILWIMHIKGRFLGNPSIVFEACWKILEKESRFFGHEPGFTFKAFWDGTDVGFLLERFHAVRDWMGFGRGGGLFGEIPS